MCVCCVCLSARVYTSEKANPFASCCCTITYPVGITEADVVIEGLSGYGPGRGEGAVEGGFDDDDDDDDGFYEVPVPASSGQPQMMCDLVTGQLKLQHPGATHLACTTGP